MADLKISELPAAATPTGAEQVPVVQGGATVRSTIAAILAKAWDRADHTGTQPQSSITGLVAALATKAADAAVVKLTGNQVIAGIKSFSSPPLVPDDSWAIADTAGLQDALDALPTDSATVHKALTETITGDKTLTGQVIVKADAVFDVRGYTGWDPIASTNDAAFDAALDAALAAGGGVVLLPPVLGIANLNDVGAGVDLQGRGSRQSGGASEILCTAAGAGIRYADLATPQSGGISSGFRVNGNGVATAPMRLGLIVGRTFQNIDIDGSVGVGLLLQGAGNCTFIEVNVQGSGTDGCQVDRAAGNTFLRCEFGNSGRYQLALVSNGAALPFLTDYPQNNSFYHCFFEYHEAGTDVQVYQGAGINNMLSDCTIATDASPTVDALRLVKIEKAGSPFSTDLKLRDCTLQFNFTDPDTIAIEIGDDTRVQLSGSTSIVNAGTGVINDADGVLEADRIVATGVTTLLDSTGAGIDFLRIRPDFSPSIACTSVTGVDRCLPVYVAGDFIGYVAVGQTPV